MKRSRVGIVAGVLVAVMAFAAVFALVSTHSPSHAAPTTLYVGSGSAGSNSGCTSPGYVGASGVQDAINAAANGDTVYLCHSGSPYTQEAVIGNKSITLTGDSNTVMQPPSTFTTTGLPAAFSNPSYATPEAIVLVWGSGTVNVTGLTIEGPWNTGGSCAPQYFNILAIAGGNVNVSNDKVLYAEDSSASAYGCQSGVGILFGRTYWFDHTGTASNLANFVGTGTVTNSIITNYQKVGVMVDGVGSSLTISGSVVSTSPTANGANGIEIARGAAATIDHNVIAYNDYAPCDGVAGGCGGNYATGVIMYSGSGQTATSGIVVKNNLFDHNQSGMDIYYDTANAVSDAFLASNNCFLNSGEYAAENDTASPTLAGFNAEGNWWGNATGPTDSGNPGGTGGAILGTVDYAHFLTSPAAVCAGPAISKLAVTPSPVAPHGAFTVTATATNALPSVYANVASAKYSIDGGTFTAMSAASGSSFGGQSVKLTISPAALSTTGHHTVCIEATDSAGFTTVTPVCTTFSVSVSGTGRSGQGNPPNSPSTAQGANQPSGSAGSAQSGSSQTTQSTTSTTPKAGAAATGLPIALIVLLLVLVFGALGGGALIFMRKQSRGTTR